MADELKVTITANLENGSDRTTWNHGQKSITQAAQGGYGGIVIVGSGAEEDLAVGDVSTLGWLFLKNLDSVNYVTYGPKSAGSMVALGRLEAGEEAALRLEPGITLRWQANTANVKVKVWLAED